MNRELLSNTVVRQISPCAFTRGFKQLFATRALIGLGETGYAPRGTALISALFPPEKRARFLGLWNASIPLGSAIGIAVSGLIAEHFGWRHSLGIVAHNGSLPRIGLRRPDYLFLQHASPGREP